MGIINAASAATGAVVEVELGVADDQEEEEEEDEEEEQDRDGDGDEDNGSVRAQPMQGAEASVAAALAEVSLAEGGNVVVGNGQHFPAANGTHQ